MDDLSSFINVHTSSEQAMDQALSFHELASTNGEILPTAKYPIVGISVFFKTHDSNRLRKGHTAILGGVDKGLKNMSVFLEEDFEKTQIFYPMNKVTHWCETADDLVAV